MLTETETQIEMGIETQIEIGIEIEKGTETRFVIGT